MQLMHIVTTSFGIDGQSSLEMLCRLTSSCSGTFFGAHASNMPGPFHPIISADDCNRTSIVIGEEQFPGSHGTSKSVNKVAEASALSSSALLDVWSSEIPEDSDKIEIEALRARIFPYNGVNVENTRSQQHLGFRT